MAKSSELLALRGKVAGKSFYAMKGVEGTLVRSINEGLSNRVKNDAAFANTRLNAAEFGSAGNFAGALVRTISKRWRYMLVAFATAMTTKSLRELIQLDTTHNWGQRGVVVTNWQNQIRQFLQTLVKNSYSENFANDVDATFSNDRVTATINVLATDSAALASKGADGVQYEVHGQGVTIPAFDTAAGRYSKSVVNETFLGVDDAPIGEAKAITITGAGVDNDTNSTIGNLLIVALPYRTLNGKKYILQELCSCKWIACPGDLG